MLYSVCSFWYWVKLLVQIRKAPGLSNGSKATSMSNFCAPTPPDCNAQYAAKAADIPHNRRDNSLVSQHLKTEPQIPTHRNLI